MVELGIDLGTANTVVCDTGQGVVFDEPSVLLMRRNGARRGRVVTLGQHASELVGRTPAGMTAIRPLQDGVITDLETARAYLRAVVRRIAQHPWQRSRSRVVIGVPGGATDLEQRALLEAADEAGISRATALDEPIAGAVGCGIDPLERRVHMVIDVGGGTAEVTAFCYGGVLTSRSCRVAGDEMTLAVYRHLREEHELIVAEQTAEEIKIRAGVETGPSLVVQGRDAGSGRPRVLTLPVAEITDVIRPLTDTIIQTLAACLDDLPAQATADVLADGILLFGGAALTRGFSENLEQAFGFPITLAANPLTCVAEGAAQCLRSPDLLAAYGRS
ncbi:rod shape-determining protein [Pseudonocardia asaccharolytica]|uniref:Cell shape-determining protein MreB n=1 Tax=Pseudonocardia asaccharolytica DSM 44247 = NBRC 16224 TaxID=1123024 RepID=A0A511D287_9PSEU|nr:rod shape-determining protein [Pseudonocardia asaccharolytica]GEL18890.1 rod shape-determining protein [Pseudonocardia asaccharolytica DSM 44247 = NBRC 16224]